MPVHCFVDDRRLVEQGLRNYWGYNTIGFFAPEPRYSASGKVNEFKTMVKTLHSAGLEVILDVVYNHTAEGNELGPTLCFRGIDNGAYYRLAHRRAAPLHGLHRHAATRSTCSIRACCSSSWTRCATGSPRCTSTASASTSRRPWRASCTRSIACGAFLRHPAAGPGAQRRKADRGAVGSRRGRLPGRQLPARLGGVE